MSTGRFVRLFFLKDVRRYLWPLGMVFAMELSIVLQLYSRAPGFYAMLAAIIAYLIGLYLTMDVIQLDWPGRDLRFVFTRPVPGEAIFFAKILFLSLFLILTGWGFKELDYAILGMPLHPLDHLCLLIEATIHFGAGMGLVALFALFLGKNSHVFLGLGLLLVAILLVAFASALFPSAAAIPQEHNHPQLCWKALAVLLGLCGFIGAVMLTALARYRAHQFGLPLMFVIGAMILDLVICLEGARVGASRLGQEQAGHMPPHLREQIRFSNHSSLKQNEQTEWDGSIAYHSLGGPNVEGIKPPYYFRIVGSQSAAALRSGKIIRSVDEPVPIAAAQDIGDLMGVSFEANMIGANSPILNVSYQRSGTTLRAFTYLPSRLPAGEDLTGVTIKGEAKLEIHRAYVAGSIPVKPGAVFSRPRQRCEITAVSSWASNPGPGVFIKLTSVKLPLMLRGDTDDSSDSLSCALVWQPSNVMLSGQSGSTSHSTFPVDIAISDLFYSRPGNPAPGNPPPSPDWIKGVELVFLGNEICGEITVPYEVDNVTLTR